MVPGTSVAKVNAEDQDVTVPNNQFGYEITGQESAKEYFFINPTSGEISLAKPVLETNTSRYTVVVTATDRGEPPKTSTATVQISVKREQGELKFSTDLYTAEVSENDNVGKIVTKVVASPGVSIPFNKAFKYILHSTSNVAG